MRRFQTFAERRSVGSSLPQTAFRDRACGMMGQLRKRTFAHSATLVMRELCCITMLDNPSKQVGHPHHGLYPPSDRDPRR
jgi:hypothetical protein